MVSMFVFVCRATVLNSLYSMSMSWGCNTVRLDSLDCCIIQQEHTEPIFAPSSLSNTHICGCTNTGMQIHTQATYTHMLMRELQKPENKTCSLSSQVGRSLDSDFQQMMFIPLFLEKENGCTWQWDHCTQQWGHSCSWPLHLERILLTTAKNTVSEQKVKPAFYLYLLILIAGTNKCTLCPGYKTKPLT